MDKEKNKFTEQDLKSYNALSFILGQCSVETRLNATSSISNLMEWYTKVLGKKIKDAIKEE
jgi:hypothetical protein